MQRVRADDCPALARWSICAGPWPTLWCRSSKRARIIRRGTAVGDDSSGRRRLRSCPWRGGTLSRQFCALGRSCWPSGRRLHAAPRPARGPYRHGPIGADPRVVAGPPGSSDMNGIERGPKLEDAAGAAGCRRFRRVRCSGSYCGGGGVGGAEGGLGCRAGLVEMPWQYAEVPMAPPLPAPSL